mmetsp:Transcript_41288/g.109325  ORF Transcript_41288/g.109325 Transcript_41288/m.109325 type:complete len:299 (-) Transcript_41288:609-1505(-)
MSENLNSSSANFGEVFLTRSVPELLPSRKARSALSRSVLLSATKSHPEITVQPLSRPRESTGERNLEPIVGPSASSGALCSSGALEFETKRVFFGTFWFDTISMDVSADLSSAFWLFSTVTSTVAKSSTTNSCTAWSGEVTTMNFEIQRPLPRSSPSPPLVESILKRNSENSSPGNTHFEGCGKNVLSILRLFSRSVGGSKLCFNRSVPVFQISVSDSSCCRFLPFTAPRLSASTRQSIGSRLGSSNFDAVLKETDFTSHSSMPMSEKQMTISPNLTVAFLKFSVIVFVPLQTSLSDC